MPLRLVLDTNIWLDWLVFNDPGAAPIKSAVASGQAEVFIALACEQELERVMATPLGKLTLDASTQAACLAECRRVAQMVAAEAIEGDHAKMPACRDPDDQKFLELASACRADFLVTKDLALLELARRKLRPLPFRIVTPQQMNAALSAA